MFTAVATTVVELPARCSRWTGSEGKLFKTAGLHQDLRADRLGRGRLDRPARRLRTCSVHGRSQAPPWHGPRRRAGPRRRSCSSASGGPSPGPPSCSSDSGTWSLRRGCPRRVVRVDRVVRGNLLVVAVVLVMLAEHWAPLGIAAGGRSQPPLRRPRHLRARAHLLALPTRLRAMSSVGPSRTRSSSLSVPCASMVLGATVWLGWERVLGFVLAGLARTVPRRWGSPGPRATPFRASASEFMPPPGRGLVPPDAYRPCPTPPSERPKDMC